MKYSMNLGRLSSAGAARPRPSDAPFRMALLGDLSGRANRSPIEAGDSLLARRLGSVDVDNLDDLLARAKLRLHLPLGGDAAAELQIQSMDDFHPDTLYQHLDVFSELTGLRRSLQNVSTFAAAAEKVLALTSQAPTNFSLPVSKSASTTIPVGRLSDFARLIGQEKEATSTESITDRLIGPLVAPDIVSAPDQRQESLLTAIDQAVSTTLRLVLHHPDFQAAEAAWRSLDLLTRRLECGTDVEVVLFDISAEEFAADLSSGDDLDETGVYKLFVEQPKTDLQYGPFSAIIGMYDFDQSPPHAELLGRMAKIAAAAQSPFVAGMSAHVLDDFNPKKTKVRHPLVGPSWTNLRQLPHSAYLGLALPRFLLRWPYGKKTEPIDSFPFEEFTQQSGLKGMLWGNGSILAALLLGNAYSEQGSHAMELGSIMTVDDLPVYYYFDQYGDQIALPCTERFIHEELARLLCTEGFMPLLSMRGRPEVRLGGFEAVHGGPLAGAWAAVDCSFADAPIETGSALSEEVDRLADEATDLVDTVVGRSTADPADDASDDVTLAPEDTGDELDELLAQLSEETAHGTSQDVLGEDDIDPELKQLLEGL